MTLWMVNPKRKGRKVARRKKRATPAQLRALAKARRAKKAKASKRSKAGRKAAATRKRKSKRRTTRRGTTVAKRRKTTKRRRSPRRRVTRRRHRRNPRGLSVRGIQSQLQQGVKDALGIEAGKVGANVVAGFIPFGGGSMVGEIAKASASAVVVAVAFRKFMGPQWGRMAMAGALLSPLEALLANVPGIGPFVSGMGEYGSLPIGEYGELPIGEYVHPEDAGMGAYVEAYP